MQKGLVLARRPRVSSMEDRNGNVTATPLSYSGGTITDPLNRQTTVAIYQGAGAGNDVITYPGIQGKPRPITVAHSYLASALGANNSLETFVGDL